MAAHGLTIARQILAFPAGLATARATLSLGAPGFDVGASDPGPAYALLYRAAGLRSDRLVRVAARSIAGRLLFLDPYPTLEAARTAYEAAVRVGSPGWGRRAARWLAGEVSPPPPGSFATGAPRYAEREPVSSGLAAAAEAAEAAQLSGDRRAGLDLLTHVLPFLPEEERSVALARAVLLGERVSSREALPLLRDAVLEAARRRTAEDRGDVVLP